MSEGSFYLEYVLDGKRFDTLEEFYAEVGRVLIGGEPWGENLDALNNLLCRGSGLIPDEFRLIWRHAEPDKNSGQSGQALYAGSLMSPRMIVVRGLVHFVWIPCNRSRERLGYTETVRQLTSQLRDCHPTALIKTAWALRAALRGQGPTVFDWLVTLISEHSNVELLLVEGD